MAMKAKFELHEEDAPASLLEAEAIAIDTETMGLRVGHDRLCLAQISTGDGMAHLVRFAPESDYHAPILRQLCEDKKILKIFHFARFDLAMLHHHLNVWIEPVYCTRTASKLARTYSSRHGLKSLCRELLKVDISKQKQSSDWGRASLKKGQMDYAADDVRHLHALKKKLDDMLKREGRYDLAYHCFECLMTRAALDVHGWAQEDIFAH